jgi:two-component system, chemotaxis family, protein-glutamate methylesterase/glutaminase
MSKTSDLVVIGASAGGVPALTELVAQLPGDFDASICIVLHLSPGSPSALSSILGRAGALPCRTATDGAPLRRGEILVAPPDRHLMVDDGHVVLEHGPRENGHRPSIDVLFRSAANARDGHVVGVILTGSRDDGSVGLATIKQQGGVAIVQDPSDATYSGMPFNAIARAQPDAVVPMRDIGSTITRFVTGAAAAAPFVPRGRPEDLEPVTSICPECGGVLSEQPVAGITQWVCKVGHRYSPETLADAQALDVEAAMWAAVRALEDRHSLLQRMADEADHHGQVHSGRSFRTRADDALRQAELVRRSLGEAGANALRPMNDDGGEGE